jgi:hypothetical protein
MSPREMKSFKFPPEDLERWQTKADKETAGNLTEWIRQRCNAPQKDSLQRKIDEILKILRAWK